MLADEDILALAPAIAYQQKQQRYVGDAVNIALAQIPASDLGRLRVLYGFLSELYVHLTGPVTSHVIDIAQTHAYLKAVNYRHVFDQINQLGNDLSSEQATPEVRKVYHDVRAGSLSALMMHADFLAGNEGDETDVERLFLLSRDHLKIMRNGIPELDPEGYQQDLQECLHGVELFREKWAGAEYQLADQAQPIQVDFHCEFHGSISECCMEFAALDRVIYNLINNASRYALDGRVSFNIVPLENQAADTNLRFTVANRISADQRQILVSRFGDRPGQLFRGGFTTDGHGLGMRICADVVTHGYDLHSLGEALEGGYLGVCLLQDHFVVWFHWPGHRRT